MFLTKSAQNFHIIPFIQAKNVGFFNIIAPVAVISLPHVNEFNLL